MSECHYLPLPQIALLREELQSRAHNHVTSVTPDVSAPDYQSLMNNKRQLEKDIEVFKARLTVEERDKIKLQGQISVLDSQVKRYRGQVQSSVSVELGLTELFSRTFHSSLDLEKMCYKLKYQLSRVLRE